MRPPAKSKRVEVRKAVGPANDRLPVDHEGLRPEPLGGLNDGREPGRPE
jgi:hypothetical protein